MIAMARESIIASGQLNPDQLLQLGTDRVKNNIRALRRLTCEEQTSREFYLPPKDAGATVKNGAGNSSAPLPLPALLSASLQDRKLLWKDRLRVELSLFDGKDMFSWPDGGAFNSGSLDGLVTFGATLSGVLGAFDLSVLMNDADPTFFRYQQTFEGFGSRVAEYSYKVSSDKSHLIVPGPNGRHTAIPYDGFFLLDVATGDLRRLAVELNAFPGGGDLVQGAISTDYVLRPIGETPAFVPLTSTMRLLFKNGQLAANNMRYSNCHEFRAESTLSFNTVPDVSGETKAKSIVQDLPPVPQNRLLKLALNAPIDSDTAVTGDPIQAHVTKSVKGKDGRVVLPAGAVAHGRILRLVRYAYPFDAVELILSFDGLEIGGTTVSIHLSPPEISETPEARITPRDARSNVLFPAQSSPIFVQHDKTQSTIAQEDRKNGTGTFEFNHTNHIHLPRGHVTEWTID